MPVGTARPGIVGGALSPSDICAKFRWLVVRLVIAALAATTVAAHTDHRAIVYGKPRNLSVTSRQDEQPKVREFWDGIARYRMLRIHERLPLGYQGRGSI